MSKQKLKRVVVKLKDITVCTSGPHYAEWRVNGVFQKWLSKSEMQRILRSAENRTKMTMRLVNQLKKRRRK